MRHVVIYFGIFSLVFLVTLGFHTASGKQTVKVKHVPDHFVLAAEPPVLTAMAYAIFDIKTGQLLATQKGRQVLPIASVTKLFAGAVALRHLQLETTVEVSASAVAEEGRSGRLSVGEKYTYRELLFPLLLESSNDAAAILQQASSTDFVLSMNDFAKTTGAFATRFTDASGLSDKNQSTAEDLVLLTSYLYKTEPHLFDITRLSKRMGPYVGWVNNSPVWQDSYLGGKHGYTEAALRTIVALFTENLTTEPRAVGYVVLGSKDLSADVEILRQFVQSSVTFK